MRKILQLVCLLGVSFAAVAQAPKGAWANLSKLAPGQKIQIVEVTKKKHSGTLVNVSDSAIAFNDAAGQKSVQRQDVGSVRLMENTHRLRNTLIGAGVGAGAGAVTTLAICSSGGSSNWFSRAKGVCAGVGAGTGGIIGTIIGAVAPDHETVFSVSSR